METVNKLFIQESTNLINFISNSPSAFHAIDNVANMLHGFQELNLCNEWDIKTGGHYFVRYNGTALIAFTLAQDLASQGFRMIASHSDSPTFRIKPQPEYPGPGLTIKLNTETYGGAILHSWLDRPLGLAGRVISKGNNSLHPTTYLIDLQEPIGTIPSLAIHMNRSVNDNLTLNKQTDMQILCRALGEQISPEPILKQKIANKLNIPSQDIIDFDLYTYVMDAPRIVGLDRSLILSPKLDNLCMLYESVQALLDTTATNTNKMVIIFDNEEVGSGTKQGAASPLVKDIIRRICSKLSLNEENFQRTIYNSFLVSADMAHAIHPNHPESNDPIPVNYTHPTPDTEGISVDKGGRRKI